MSATNGGRADTAAAADAYRIPRGGVFASAWKIAVVFAVIGGVGALLGYMSDERRFAFSWLFAFTTFLTLGLGSIFFVVVQHLTAAGWSVTVRRSAEFFVGAVPVFLVLFLPVLASVGHLYEWTHAEHGESGHGAPADEHEGEPHGDNAPSLLSPSKALAQPPEEHAAHPEGAAHGAPQGGVDSDPGIDAHPAHTPMEAQLHHELLEHKSKYLNLPFFFGRAILYFAVWITLALLYFGWSTRQDRTGDPRLTVKMQRWAPGAIILFGLTLTFAAFDWLMSLEPAWYSTIFGVYVFASSAVAVHATVTLVTMGLRSNGYLGDAVNVEHYHDLGKLLFGFVCFWTYIGFSQWMLIWYAGIPEEATYYHHRYTDGGWKAVSLLLMIGHFALPFLFLISRVAKRRLVLFGIGSVWLLIMHVVDMYWFVMPYADEAGLALHWMDAACLMTVGGVYLGVVFWLMNRYPLIPVGDPRLDRALHFVNA